MTYLSVFLLEIIIKRQKFHQKLFARLENRPRQNFCRDNRANRARFLSPTQINEINSSICFRKFFDP